MPVFSEGRFDPIVPSFDGDDDRVRLLQPSTAPLSNQSPQVTSIPSPLLAPVPNAPVAGIPATGASPSLQAEILAAPQTTSDLTRLATSAANATSTPAPTSAAASFADAPASLGGVAVGGVGVDGSTTTTAVSVPSLDASPAELQQYVQLEAARFGWTGAEFEALRVLLANESSWRATIPNQAGTSTAFGLFQFLSSTAQQYGIDHPNLNGRIPGVADQVRAGLQYIGSRYGSPSAALAHWQSRVPINGRDVGNWY